jgi:hypothetical protein
VTHSVAADPDEAAGEPAAHALRAPGGLLAWRDLLFVADRQRHAVLVFSAADLAHRRTFGCRGGGLGQLREPNGLAMLTGGLGTRDSGGGGGGGGGGGAELVVCDTSNHRLACFTADGVFTRAVGRRGTAPGCFVLPADVATARGLLVVAEVRRVQLLAADGEPRQVIAPAGCGSLAALCVWSGRVLLADSENRLLHELHLRAPRRFEAGPE